ncbi:MULTISPECIES: helix-turn-helix transcriptional regulator [unclassified Caulobacter]|uniref:helix-turn-helix domain-containing protein n=1 Tax=unclassified Caulobacter TaxID=2648921 RepID=UPI0011773336|nr:helix-turn-helix transcriptional regulator [Caulobacter sp. X]
MGVIIEAMREKLGLLSHLRGVTAEALAERLDRSKQTVSGWANGTRTSAPGETPEAMLQPLAEALADIVDALTIDQARDLWHGPLDAFERAIRDAADPRLADVLANAPRRKMLTFRKLASGQRHLVRFRRQEPDWPGLRASVGDFFELDIDGPFGGWFILLISSPVGLHLAEPIAGQGGRLDSRGFGRVPGPAGSADFGPPAGLHEFILLAGEGPASFTVGDRSDEDETPLGQFEQDQLARELVTLARGRPWSKDAIQVMVED